MAGKKFADGWAHVLAGRSEDGERIFGALRKKRPEDPLANFGLLFLLHRRPSAPKQRAPFAKAVLQFLTKPRDPLDAFAVRYAANSLAYDTFDGVRSTKRLEEGLAYAEIGARHDPDYDDEHAPVAATRVELLVALGREEEAYAIVARVLERKPAYKHFEALKGSEAFRRWQAESTAAVAGSFAALIGAELATPLNCAMLAKLREQNENQHPAPLERETIERLRMPKTRGERTPSVVLPPSVKAILRFDAKLRIRKQPFFEKTFVSATMAEVFESSVVASAFRHLKKSDEAEMPALIELPLATDQRVFLYVAKANGDGEYPILRWDDEPCVWISSGCLQDEICAEQALPGAEKRKLAAKKAVARWLKKEPAG